MCATHAPIATGPWGDGRGRGTRVTAPPGHVPPWYRAPQHIPLAPLPEFAAKPCVAPQFIIPCDPAMGNLSPPLVEHLQALRVPRVIPHLRRDMARLTPVYIARPVLGQGQAEVEQGMVVARDVPHEDADLAVVDLPPVATPLALHPDRVRAPLGEATGIKGDDAIGFPNCATTCPTNTRTNGR
jgi:hypothetical protein